MSTLEKKSQRQIILENYPTQLSWMKKKTPIKKEFPSYLQSSRGFNFAVIDSNTKKKMIQACVEVGRFRYFFDIFSKVKDLLVEYRKTVNFLSERSESIKRVVRREFKSIIDSFIRNKICELSGEDVQEMEILVKLTKKQASLQNKDKFPVRQLEPKQLLFWFSRVPHLFSVGKSCSNVHKREKDCSLLAKGFRYRKYNTDKKTRKSVPDLFVKIWTKMVFYYPYEARNGEFCEVVLYIPKNPNESRNLWVTPLEGIQYQITIRIIKDGVAYGDEVVFEGNKDVTAYKAMEKFGKSHYLIVSSPSSKTTFTWSFKNKFEDFWKLNQELYIRYSQLWEDMEDRKIGRKRKIDEISVQSVQTDTNNRPRSKRKIV